MTPDKVEAALASLGIDSALVEEGLSYFHGAGDDGDKLYVSEIRQALSVLTEALAELSAENTRLREIATAFWPVMQSMRPLVLNLERLKDAAMKDPDHAR